MVWCNQCGRRAAGRGTIVCGGCGAPLTVRPGEDTRAVPVLELGAESVEAPSRSDDGPFLLVERGPNAGSRWHLRDGRTTIGRHPGSDIFLDDVSVSRHHAVAVRVGDELVIEDPGSLNGTYLNGHGIEGSHALRHGDRLQVGRYRLVVVS